MKAELLAIGRLCESAMESGSDIEPQMGKKIEEVVEDKADHQAIVKEAETCLAMQVRYPEEWMKQRLWRSLVIIGSLARIRCLYRLASNPC